jgi:hypothetical protein
VAPGEVSRLRNRSGYTPQSWNEARSQLLGMHAPLGALLGPAHPVVGVYGRFLRKYSRMLTRREFEIYYVHGRRLGPSIIMFHFQLVWWDWLVLQLDSGETESTPPPDFGADLSMLETQNNLVWLPSITNVPFLFSLSLGGAHPRTSTRGSKITSRIPCPSRGMITRGYPIGGGAPRRSFRPSLGPEHWTPCHVHREHPFSRNIRAHRVSEDILLAGTPPGVSRSRATGPVCVPWYANGLCYGDCARSSGHGVLNAKEALEFHAWCQVAYA